MPIDLLAMLGKFETVSDQETPDAYFRTHIPVVGSSAYLNIVYKASPKAVLDEVDQEVRLPESLLDFYNAWNGARLFVGALSVNGCVPTGQLLDRTDPFKLLPFDVRDANKKFTRQTKDAGLVCIGSYSYDGSIVCLHRETQSVSCYVGTDFSKLRQEWRSLDHWLRDEVVRISLLFDTRGNRLVEKERLLPGLEPSRVV
jgi:hypothetical protein